jgi:hypothetical protein
MALPEQGHVLGIDVGYASTRKTTGFCAVSWDAQVVCWSCTKTGKNCDDRAGALRQLLGDRRQVLVVAVDGPLRRDLQLDSSTCRTAEKLLSRGKFQRRGKPGPANAGSGPRLHQEATDLAKFALKQLSVAKAGHEPRIDERAVVEAFPNMFLGVLCDETNYPKKPERKRRWTDTLYPVVRPRLEAMVRCFLPLRNLRGNLEIGDHEEIGALACAMTALCVAAKRFVAVGSEVDGYIILPPSDWWGRQSDGTVAWARVELLKNLKSVAGDMSRPAIYEDRRKWGRSLLPEREEQNQKMGC